MKNRLRLILRGVAVLVVLLLLIQGVPYGKDHTNPPVESEPKWDSPATRDLASRACFDCHGNETIWPWYSSIAPLSWLIYNDVQEGRRHLNFSEWGRGGKGKSVGKIVKTIRKGEMPMLIYLPTHPQAWLTAAEKQALMDGLLKSIR
ncbi:MAG: cytochrome C [Syntrophobacterales bacterium CG03_land_8_20_14_0_80_58_14]|nr:MAG: cytochrome C [Syntrophaceae bacterium CG2_30_58_14]PIV05901.1 MAG: cytochrome C [Syntrophobacterales bacterium CG03_land_8_20_14_0_80_58_14]